MQLDKYEVENLLERYGDLIDNGEFEKLFRALFKDYEPEKIGAVSSFFYDSGLEYLEDMDYVPTCAFYGSDLDVVVIPNGIKTIEDYAFAESKISKIIIPKTVQEIADTAFWKCDNLTEIDYNGTKDAWYDLGVRLPKKTKVNFR